MSLAKEYRLHSKTFQTIFQGGRRFSDSSAQFFTLKADKPGFGISVRKKEYPLAVDRNRIKRVLKDCYHTEKEKLALYSIVVKVKGGLPVKDRKELRVCLDGFFKRYVSFLGKPVVS